MQKSWGSLICIFRFYRPRLSNEYFPSNGPLVKLMEKLRNKKAEKVKSRIDVIVSVSAQREAMTLLDVAEEHKKCQHIFVVVPLESSQGDPKFIQLSANKFSFRLNLDGIYVLLVCV